MILRPGPAKGKSRHAGRTGYIKEIQDHEHTISEKAREEMDIE